MINIDHELKTDPKYFEAIEAGFKKFEVRKNDRNFQIGQIVKLREYDITTKSYSGKEILIHIIYIFDDPNYCKEGFIVFGFNRLVSSAWW